MSGNQSQQGTKGNETKDTSDDIGGNLSRRSISREDSSHARENFFVNGRHVFVAGETWSVACESCVLLDYFLDSQRCRFLRKSARRLEGGVLMLEVRMKEPKRTVGDYL